MENNNYPKIDESKLVNKQGVCPNCGEENLEYDSIQLEDDMCYYPYKCNNCGVKGEEWYYMQFNGHNVFDENGNFIELS